MISVLMFKIVTYVQIWMFVDGVQKLNNVYQEIYKELHVQVIVFHIGYLKKEHVLEK